MQNHRFRDELRIQGERKWRPTANAEQAWDHTFVPDSTFDPGGATPTKVRGSVSVSCMHCPRVPRVQLSNSRLYAFTSYLCRRCTSTSSVTFSSLGGTWIGCAAAKETTTPPRFPLG
jgi:hypothetical protein